MEYKKYECDSYNIYTIKTSKFKNCYMEVIFKNNVKKETITERIMLCDILTQSSKKYKTAKDLRIECEELYNASVGSVIARIGNTLTTNFKLSFLDPEYSEESICEQAITLLFELIQNPNITKNGFDEHSFNIVKNNLKADILAQKERPVGYAIRKMLEELAPESASAINQGGYLKDLELITPISLVKTYETMLKSDICEIFFIGNVDMDKIVKIITKTFKNRIIKNKHLKLYSDVINNKKLKTVKETDDFNQGHLIIPCSLNNLTEREKNYVLPVYNVILGNGSLTTKLYKYLREENSLCYTTRSIYQKYDKMLLIYAGIEDKSYNLAVKLATKALKEMDQGQISDEELNGAIKLITTSLKINLDSPVSLIDNYVFNIWDKLPDINERIQEINTVSIDELKTVSSKIKMEMIYFLQPNKKDGDVK